MPDIPKQVTFQDSDLLSGLQKINKKLKSLENELYALRAEKNERSRRQYKSPGRPKFRNRNYSRDNSRVSSKDSQDRVRRVSRRSNRSRNKSRKNSDDQMIEQEMVEMILNRKLRNIVNTKMVILGNMVGRCKSIQRKQKGLMRWMIEMMTHQTPYSE